MTNNCMSDVLTIERALSHIRALFLDPLKMESRVAQVGIIVLIIVAVAILVGLFYISVKMLRDVSKARKCRRRTRASVASEVAARHLKDKSNQK